MIGSEFMKYGFFGNPFSKTIFCFLRILTSLMEAAEHHKGGEAGCPQCSNCVSSTGKTSSYLLVWIKTRNSGGKTLKLSEKTHTETKTSANSFFKTIMIL